MLKHRLEAALKYVQTPSMGATSDAWAAFHKSEALQMVEKYMNQIVALNCNNTKKIETVPTIWQRAMIQTEPNKVQDLNAGQPVYTLQKITPKV